MHLGDAYDEDEFSSEDVVDDEDFEEREKLSQDEIDLIYDSLLELCNQGIEVEISTSDLTIYSGYVTNLSSSHVKIRTFFPECVSKADPKPAAIRDSIIGLDIIDTVSWERLPEDCISNMMTPPDE